MATKLDLLMDQFERGHISRRDVIRGLTALAAAPAASLLRPFAAVAQAQGAPIVTVRNLNHAHIDVSDFNRSTEFYAVMFGARVTNQSANYWTMVFPAVAPGLVYWLPMNLATGKAGMDGSGLMAGHYAHMGIGVELSDPQATTRIADTLKQRFPFTNPKLTGPWNKKGEFPGARSIYMTDPDGLLFQLIRPSDDGYAFTGGAFKEPPSWTPPKEKPLVRFRSLNHMHFDVSDLDKSAAFYKALFGATFRARSSNGGGITLLLPTHTPGRPLWFSLTKAPAAKPSMDGSGVKPGQYAHLGIGIDIDEGANSTVNLAAAINKRFPFAKAAPTGPGTPDGGKPGQRSIYMRDPDGLILQLVRPNDDGWLPK